jgi:hypothetical protein
LQKRETFANVTFLEPTTIRKSQNICGLGLKMSILLILPKKMKMKFSKEDEKAF